jgi:hypothetical protein
MCDGFPRLTSPPITTSFNVSQILNSCCAAEWKDSSQQRIKCLLPFPFFCVIVAGTVSTFKALDSKSVCKLLPITFLVVRSHARVALASIARYTSRFEISTVIRATFRNRIAVVNLPRSTTFGLSIIYERKLLPADIAFSSSFIIDSS